MTTQSKSCKAEKCKRPYRAKGYCNVHYKKWRRGELPHSRYDICNQDPCRKPQHLRGLCDEHYKAKFGKKEAEVAAPEASPAPAAAPAETPAA